MNKKKFSDLKNINLNKIDILIKIINHTDDIIKKKTKNLVFVRDSIYRKITQD